MTRTAAKPPKKPYRDFPLHAHASGQWAKKIREKRVYFGSWDDPPAALEKYLRERDEWQAVQNPREAARVDGGAIRDLVNQFLAQEKRLDDGEISGRSFSDM